MALASTRSLPGTRKFRSSSIFGGSEESLYWLRRRFDREAKAESKSVLARRRERAGCKSATVMRRNGVRLISYRTWRKRMAVQRSVLTVLVTLSILSAAGCDSGRYDVRSVNPVAPPPPPALPQAGTVKYSGSVELLRIDFSSPDSGDPFQECIHNAVESARGSSSRFNFQFDWEEQNGPLRRGLLGSDLFQIRPSRAPVTCHLVPEFWVPRSTELHARLADGIGNLDLPELASCGSSRQWIERVIPMLFEIPLGSNFDGSAGISGEGFAHVEVSIKERGNRQRRKLQAYIALQFDLTLQ
jgi:hypothetical protein